MDPGRSSTGATHQHFDARTEQTDQQGNVASYSGREEPPKLPDTINPRLLDLGNLYNSMAEPQPHQSRNCRPPPYLLNTAAYIDPTTPSLNDHEMQMGEVFMPQPTQPSSHAFPPQEQVDYWQPTIDADQSARELARTLDEGRVSEDISGTDPIPGSNTYANRYILPNSNASAYGYNMPHSAFSAPVVFGQGSQMAPHINNGANLYVTNYDAWSKQSQPQATANASIFDANAKEAGPLGPSAEISYNSLGHHVIQLQQPSIKSSPFTPSSFNAPVKWPGVQDQAFPFYFARSTHYPDLPQQYHPQDIVGLPCLPSDVSNIVMPSPIDTYQDMTASSTELGFPQGTKPSDHYASDVSWPTYSPLIVTAQSPRSYSNTQNAILSPISCINQHRIKDVDQIIAQTSNIVPEQRHRSRRDYSTKPSKPGVDLSNIHQYIDPATEREHRKIRKRTRNVEGKVDRACVVCKINNRKCVASSDVPCPRLQAFFGRYKKQFSLPKFTCDVRTKLVELNMFSAQPAGIITEDGTRPDEIPIGSPEWTKSTWELLEPFRPIFDALEPDHPRRGLFKIGLTWFCVQYSYIQDVVRWRYALLLLTPDFRRHISILEQRHRNKLLQIVASIDNSHLSPNKMDLAFFLSALYDDFVNLKYLDTVDQSAGEHLRLAVEHRLILLYDILLVGKSVTRKVHQQERERRARELRCTSKAVLLSPQFPDLPRPLMSTLFDNYATVQCEALDGAPNTRKDSLRKDTACFCAWITHGIPSPYFVEFDLQPEQICRDLHDIKHEYCYDAQGLAVMYYNFDVNESPYFANLIRDTYGRVMGNLLRLYSNCLLIEAASHLDLPNIVKSIRLDDERILASWYCLCPQLIPFSAMALTFDYLMWYFQASNEEEEDILETWICDQVCVKEIEAAFREIISQTTEEYLEDQSRLSGPMENGK